MGVEYGKESRELRDVVDKSWEIKVCLRCSCDTMGS